MRIFDADRTRSIEIVEAEPFTDSTEAVCTVSVQSGTFSGHASVRFRQSDLTLFVSGLKELDRTREGSCTLLGFGLTGGQVCSLAVDATERASPFALSIALTHRERVGESDEFYDHHVRTRFDLDASAIPGFQHELQGLMEALFGEVGGQTRERPSAKVVPINPDWPSLHWRFLARDWHNPGREVYHLTGDGRTWFDELVVGDWLHIEKIHGRRWWMQLGDAIIHIALPPGKPPFIDIERNYYYIRPSEAEEQANLMLMGRDNGPFGLDDENEE
jgi:hypothetical protein